jgi:DNA/RNA endonuclease YhcR with UshA esterase domain
MRNSLVRLCLLTALFVTLPAVLLAANETSPRRVAHTPRYDAAKEVTLEGTVESLVTKPAPGKVLGGHLMVSTAKGTVDGQIGAFVLRGSHAFTATPGEKVKITGVMTTFHGQQAFLVRTIEIPDRTVVVRDAHGFFVFPEGHRPVLQTSSLGGAR